VLALVANYSRNCVGIRPISGDYFRRLAPPDGGLCFLNQLAEAHIALPTNAKLPKHLFGKSKKPSAVLIA
jgi:hypothetical protein